jgi:serine/threonine protein kinase
MDKFKISDIENALKAKLQAGSDLKILGDARRPNSWTFKFKDPSGETRVVKVLKPSTRSGDVEAASEEAALAQIAKRDDISTVKLLDSGVIRLKQGELNYLVFPFIEGTEVSQIIANEKLTEEQVLEFVESVTATILKFAQAGLIHQDIKPANIVKTPAGEYVILDLGIARFIELDHKLVKQQGPAKYLSPEQVDLGVKRTDANQRRVTFVSDVYSAGVVALR